jgi:hypothetical protein
MSGYNSIRDFFDGIRSSFQKLFGLLDDPEYDTSTPSDDDSSSPNMYTITPKQLLIL